MNTEKRKWYKRKKECSRMKNTPKLQRRIQAEHSKSVPKRKNKQGDIQRVWKRHRQMVCLSQISHPVFILELTEIYLRAPCFMLQRQIPFALIFQFCLLFYYIVPYCLIAPIVPLFLPQSLVHSHHRMPLFPRCFSVNL